MIEAWRILKARFAGQPLSGEGAKLGGGRWNSPGRAVVYASASLSLAALEIMANLQDHAALCRMFMAVRLAFDAALAKDLPASALPKDWRRPEHPELKRIGDHWLESLDSAVLKVPSAVVAHEWNYLLNPGHQDFNRIEIAGQEPFRFDKRLIK